MTTDGKDYPPRGDVDVAKDFHFKEWDALRKEIDAQVDHTRKLELAVVVGLGAFYAWFSSAPYGMSHSRFSLVIPSLLVVVAGMRSKQTLVRINEIASYIEAIEDRYASNKGKLVGWEHLLRQQFGQSRPFEETAAWFWWLTFAISVLAWFLL